jgi:hypothetical protein
MTTYRREKADRWVGRATVCDMIDYGLCGCGKHIVLRMTKNGKPQAVVELTWEDVSVMTRMLTDELQEKAKGMN